VVPHVTNAIGDWIERVATSPVKSGTNPEDEGNEADICVIELGGTVGDIESMPFIEVAFAPLTPLCAHPASLCIAALACGGLTASAKRWCVYGLGLS